MMYGSFTRQLVALLAAIGIAQTCAAQATGNPAADPQAAAGTWIPTGKLQGARTDHTATLLANGKVLVVGGLERRGSGLFTLASAELYDPATGTFTATGALGQSRSGHAAVLLPSGKVLVVGGGRDTAEVYDPVSGAWSATGSLNTPRHGFTATLLQSGEVLVVGGFDAALKGLATAELYDPTTGSWHFTGSLVTARLSHTATLLQDGRVLVVAGSPYLDPSFDFNPVLADAELYDPAAGVWTKAGSIQIPRASHTATLLQSGKVLLAGGAADRISGGGSTSHAEADLFAPALGWTLAGSMPVAARARHTSTLLLDGHVLVTGGYDWNLHRSLDASEQYDPNANLWTSTGSLGTSRSGHTATLLQNGQVLVVGGSMGPSDSSTTLDSAELYATAAPSSPYRITALFSDQAGVYQYILLQSLGPTSGSVFGLTLAVTSRTGIVKQFTFPSYPSQSNSPLCIATHSAWPILDFIVPDQFLPTDGGTISLVGVDSWTFGPLPTDGHSSLQRSSGVSGTALMQCSHFAAVLNVPIDPVIEYYNSTLDHYFISASQPDLDALDSGRSAGWQRTGSSFPAWITRNVGPLGGFVVPAGLRDVCRIYIPPNKGDSHFFSASAGECAASLAQHPDFVLETNTAFLATLPDAVTGACPSGQVPVYRLWNNRVDSNHRYTTSLTIRAEMISRGYIAEGYGPNAVALCVGGNL